jgi:hypothetical protein
MQALCHQKRTIKIYPLKIAFANFLRDRLKKQICIDEVLPSVENLRL